MFIHGGWWRALDKSDHAFVAPAFVAAGFAVAVINYDLCPGVPIATIIEQCRHAVLWVMREGPSRGAPAPLVIGGHSAGGHLTAMMYATDWRATRPRRRRRSPAAFRCPACTTSRRWCSFRTTSISASTMPKRGACRPIDRAPLTDAPLVLAVGADETSEFLRQTRTAVGRVAAAIVRPASRRRCAIAGRHHYSVVLDYADPASALTQATLALFPR